MKKLKVLLACEYSGIVRDSFIARGHDAISCDLLPTERPGPHYQGDVFDIINDGFDVGIFFPPCTYLTNAGIGYFNEERYGQKAVERKILRDEAFEFVMRLWNCGIPKIAIENPVGWINSHFRKPDQIIHPYYFGDNEMKRTCLWLKKLPKLVHIQTSDLFAIKTHLPHPEPTYIDVRREGKYYKGGEPKKRYFTEAVSGNTLKSKMIRSKTFPGIAEVMADQWG